MKLWPSLIILIFTLGCNSVDPYTIEQRKKKIERIHKNTYSFGISVYTEDEGQIKMSALSIFNSCEKNEKCWIKKVSYLGLDKKPLYEYDNKNFDPTKKNIISSSSILNYEGEDFAILKIEYSLE